MSTENDHSGGTAGWLILISCGVALIPAFGFAAWIIAGPLLLAAFILAIISLSRGNGGVFLLLTSAIFAPLFILFAPIITTSLFAVGTASLVKQAATPAPAESIDEASAAATRPSYPELAQATPGNPGRKVSWDPGTKRYVEHAANVSAQQSVGGGGGGGPIMRRATPAPSAATNARQQFGWDKKGTALDQPARR